MIVLAFTCSDSFSWAESVEYAGGGDEGKLTKDSLIAIWFSHTGLNVCLVGLPLVVVVTGLEADLAFGIDGQLALRGGPSLSGKRTGDID